MHAHQVVDGNPIIRHKFTADPTAIVHDGTVYLYTGHDEAPLGVHEYVMNDWLSFSSRDLATWTEHPTPLRATDFRWSSGRAYASKVVEHRGAFYWLVSVGGANGSGSAIAIASSRSPTGPFSDWLGRPLVAHEDLPPTDNKKANLDPTALIVEGVPYLWWGNGTCYFAELRGDLSGLASPIATIDLPKFEEGAHVHAANGWFYLCYGYGAPERVAYAMSRSIKGPWEFVGILNELAGNSETNRPCIFELEGQSYFAYHNGALPGGGSHRRSVCIDRLYYNADGTMRRVVMSSEGISS
jgi:beta-xylosidase